MSRGRCSYPLRTLDPTGRIELASGAPLTLGDFFAIWGQPLGPRRIAAFQGPVVSFVDGQRSAADPRSLPLRRHAVVVLELGGVVPPHARYAFPTP